MAGSHDGTATEVFDGKLLVALITDSVGFINATGLGFTDLSKFVGHLTIGHNLAHAPDFQVTRVGVYDHVEILVGAVFLFDEGTEHVFKNAHHRGPVYVFARFEFCKYIY